jgi:hypothetical protein
MKNLNSILLEGDLIDDPVYIPGPSPDTVDRCTFSLDCGPTAPSIPILAHGRLALRCHELMHQHTSVRVVGRVICDTETSASTVSFSLTVVVEHVEIKPVSVRSPALAEAADAY